MTLISEAFFSIEFDEENEPVFKISTPENDILDTGMTKEVMISLFNDLKGLVERGQNGKIVVTFQNNESVN